MAIVLVLLFVCAAYAQPDLAAGKKRYEAQCAGCHAADAAGGERGPTLFRDGALRPDDQLRDIIQHGRPNAGMPAFDLGEPAMTQVVAYLRTLRPARGATGVDQRLAESKPVPFTEVVSPRTGNWPSYHGQISGNRHSPLNQINAGNVSRLALRWMHTIPGTQRLEVTPVVIDGIMYLTAANSAYAVDARNGKVLWRFQQPRTKGVIGDAAGGINRGVAVLDDSVFLVTDHAHLLALDRRTGQLRWDKEMADYRQHYGATAAPLVVNDVVVSGVSGGDEGARGFVAAFRASTGQEVWRFWTVPAPGDPEAKTWIGRAIEHGCAATWMTGTYDPSTSTLFWTTGNPCPDYNGDERKGDNLYSDSVLALDPATGKLKWFYQYTPHDLHDWDAQQTPMVIDARFQGRQRQLLVQASRNGFFYVLDRTNGKVLVAKPFVKKMTWASGIGADGRPQVLPGTEPTPEGVKVCPSVEGATNWFSTAFNPSTGLFYVQALEKCSIYTKSSAWWQPGDSFYGGGTRRVRDETPQKLLRALDIQTGDVRWELPQEGPANTWGGVLSTAGGLVFFGNDNGGFSAADAGSGRLLWQFDANQSWKASPMTYSIGGTQYVAVAGGPNVLVFALPASAGN
jgi:alcohol dehydrogenase (cytochrome c)